MKDIKIGESETFEEYKKREFNQVTFHLEKRGRAKNTGRLSEEQQEKIFEFLKERPIAYNINEEPMWSVKSVLQLIQLKLDIKLPLSTVRNYLIKWFNIEQMKKGNQIKSLLTNNDIFKNTKNEETIILYVKLYKNSFIQIVTRTNENKFIFNGNKNQKNLINTFKYLISYYKNKNISLIFNYDFYGEIFFNKLINKNVRIFYIEKNIKNFICNEDNSFQIKEFEKIKQKNKQIGNKKTIKNNDLKNENFDDSIFEKFDDIPNFLDVK